MEVYNVYINGEIAHEKVPEKELFDLMQIMQGNTTSIRKKRE